MQTNHLDPLKKQLRALQMVEPPSPWRRVATIAVGGLRTIGFDRSSELLLVVSSAGRGVIDCRSGEKVARDYDEYYGNEQFLEADGIGPLQGKTVRISGLFGGGLPISTQDGWSMELVTLDWPVEDILLVEPFSFLYGSLYGKPTAFHKIGAESELRACGFSYTGNSLVVATSSDVAVFSRDGG
ncbi:hypothetical protein [Xanthomonas pisi]|uniref:Uncharacterized protein n=2 Tax=Xanthomonas TaxID=338 RepID=A0A2S7CSY9_9XANT|nr:hypothetical protein [Xanthomonas pisi]PPU64682.1 hypothetical protein XpiCFBP4643_21830 [Xanthomonas pisi]